MKKSSVSQQSVVVGGSVRSASSLFDDLIDQAKRTNLVTDVVYSFLVACDSAVRAKGSLPYKVRLSDKVVQRPRSGTLKLYDREKLRKFRVDGFKWSSETFGKIRINGESKLVCCYTRCTDNKSFYRRMYWLRNPETGKRASSLVLVHHYNLNDFVKVSDYERLSMFLGKLTRHPTVDFFNKGSSQQDVELLIKTLVQNVEKVLQLDIPGAPQQAPARHISLRKELLLLLLIRALQMSLMMLIG